VTDFVAVQRLSFQQFLGEAADDVPIVFENLAGRLVAPHHDLADLIVDATRRCLAEP
jgi:hypothetical protein